MGEIGIPRREFLYEITNWEAERIIQGYHNRRRDLWSVVRWHSYSVMCAMPYTDLKKAGIHNPTDLLPLPWDSDNRQSAPVSPDEVAEMQELIRAHNAQSESKPVQ